MLKKAPPTLSGRSLLTLIASAWAGGARTLEDHAPLAAVGSAGQQTTAQGAPPAYTHELPFSPQEACYFRQISKALTLNRSAMALLAQNGFVVSDEQAWERFLDAYAWIYWRDLPVLITTDSILQAVSQSYDDLLQDLEQHVLAPRLFDLLQRTRAQLKADRLANTHPELDPLYADVAVYLEVAIALMEGNSTVDGDAQRYLDWALLANTPQEVELFGHSRRIDFTLLQPRGHYREFEEWSPASVQTFLDWKQELGNGEPLALTRPGRLHYTPAGYFRAMSWLAQVDFRFVDYDPRTSKPALHKEAIAAALILSQALERAGQRQTWDELDAMLKALVGRSDNLTLAELDQFIRTSGLTSPAAILSADPTALLQRLGAIKEGRQQVNSQIVHRHIDNASPQALPPPISFMLMGQRCVVDSYVMSNLVYDRLFVDGHPVERALPDPLDVAYALGNDRAKDHLDAELARYGYEDALLQWRDFVDALEPAFWEAPIYNQWLHMIRSLKSDIRGENTPAAMQTAAWADKMLQTQLASWAQLRHHNILYAKQPFSDVQVVCQFPDAYVEPYPAFFHALADYAASGQAMLGQIKTAGLPAVALKICRKALNYFEAVASVAERLGAMAAKERRGEALSSDDMAFVQNAVVRHVEKGGVGCGGPLAREEWDGWYRHMFYKMDDNPALIADVHTNPTTDPASSLYPPRVVHVATGPVSPVFFIVDRGEGPTLFVGPAFTYFQVIESGDQTQPPRRLTNEQWRMRLQGADYPQPPAWTSSFRVPPSWRPTVLRLPMESIEP